MPEKATFVVLLLGLAAAGVQTASQAPAKRDQPNPDALVLADFRERIEKYMKVHEEVEKGSAEQEETNDPAKIHNAQVNLAERLRAARRDARPGDIFTPAIRAMWVPRRGLDSALSLLVAWVLADHHDAAVPPDDLALLTDLLHARSNLHRVPRPFRPLGSGPIHLYR